MKYATGLVVGKFCPMHKGHELVIQTALEQCEKVIVLSYTSEDYAGCNSTTREKWLKGIDWARQYAFEVHVLDDLVYMTDDAPDRVHRKFCAEYLLDTLETTVQAVFSSESYGQGFADYLSAYFSSALSTSVTVDHVLVDGARIKYPISGTQLRESIARGDYSLANKFLAPDVAASFVRKILFLGGESTGKSTLATSLFKHFDSAMAPEFGRVHYDNRNKKLMYEDMAFIAKTQIEIEDSRASYVTTDQYVFCDTSPLTTSFYSREWFGRVSKELRDLVRNTTYRYHKVYLCAPDFPMVQDGTRQDETFRMKGHQFYIDELEFTGVDYTILTGTNKKRLAQVLKDLA